MEAEAQESELGGGKIEFTRIKFTNPQRLVESLKRKKKDFLMKKTSESTQIIFDKTMFYFPHSKNFPREYIFMFKKVNDDVQNWLDKRINIALPPKHDVSVYNIDYDFDKGEVTGTDLNHAYWRIAFIKGMISEKTYETGLIAPSKALRLATLSVLGRRVNFTQYDGGKIGQTICLKEGDERKRMIYKYIRYFCYQMMYECSVLLGDDFDCWKTDCIYYRKTPENIKKVQDFFTSKNMLFKQLYY